MYFETHLKPFPSVPSIYKPSKGQIMPSTVDKLNDRREKLTRGDKKEMKTITVNFNEEINVVINYVYEVQVPENEVEKYINLAKEDEDSMLDILLEYPSVIVEDKITQYNDCEDRWLVDIEVKEE